MKTHGAILTNFSWGLGSLGIAYLKYSIQRLILIYLTNFFEDRFIAVCGYHCYLFWSEIIDAFVIPK